jgi:small subunit ribosomal protein S6
VNIVRQYELVFIIRPDLEEEAVEAVIEKVKALAENNGAEVTKLDKWGKRRLAYEIKHVREGYYVVMNFKGEAAVAAELDRVLKITDEILRHIIVRDDDN